MPEVQLAAVYAALPDTDPDVARRVKLVTVPVAFASVEVPLADAIGRVGPQPADVLRVNVCDPRCGVGMFLVIGAYKLADAYASRLTGSRRRAEPLARRLLLEVILSCVYEMDTLAVELARLGPVGAHRWPAGYRGAGAAHCRGEGRPWEG